MDHPSAFSNSHPSAPTDSPESPQSAEDNLLQKIAALIEPLGYEVVCLEVVKSRQRLIRVYIDHPAPAEAPTKSLEDSAVNSGSSPPIGIEDCLRVNRVLDEPIDQLPEIETLFHGGSYELEISSPGIDRPLRRAADFERFSGREVRIHVYRPLTGEELGNREYQLKNPKQKNFVGKLVGLEGGQVHLQISRDDQNAQKNKKREKKSENTSNQVQPNEEVWIPLQLISKANIEPQFNRIDEREWEI